MRKTQHKRLHPAMSVLIGGIIFLACIFIAYLYGKSLSSRSVATQKTYHDMIIKYETQTAVSLLQELFRQSEKGALSFEQAKEQGADLLRELRYGDAKEGYFWADTTDGVNVVLYGNKDVEGTNRWDAFLGGVYYIREIIKNGMKENGGYTDYYFPKKGDTIPVPKRSYSILFAPFGWVVGTGYYPEDIK